MRVSSYTNSLYFQKIQPIVGGFGLKSYRSRLQLQRRNDCICVMHIF